MVLNYIWIGFFLIAFVIAVVKLLFWGDYDVFPAMMDSTFSSSKTAFEISLGLTGVLSLWLGVMKVGEKGGVVNVLAKLLSPVFCKLFPDIPKGHPVTGSIFMNIAANMLGLDNAATPLGLKAMEQMQELNQKKDTASNPMIMFLVLNTSGLTLIPVSHRHLAISAHQSAESCHAIDTGRSLCHCSWHYLVVCSDASRDDEQGQYYDCQHPVDEYHYGLYCGRCPKESQRL